jgi:deoxyxylulose-5-phosphate synthase
VRFRAPLTQLGGNYKTRTKSTSKISGCFGSTVLDLARKTKIIGITPAMPSEVSKIMMDAFQNVLLTWESRTTCCNWPPEWQHKEW